MPHEDRSDRRTFLATAGAAGLAVVHAQVEAAPPPAALRFANAQFYKGDKFDPEAAKDAIVRLMEYHKYPVFEGVREKLWVSDYGIGEYTSLGLAANMFVNNEAENRGDRFMLMDLFLLPGQMLPEHYHLATDKARPKMEGWLVRHGLSHIIGEGEETPGLKDMLPKSQLPSATVFHAQVRRPGEWAQLNRPTARHSQLAGPEGAIVTEVANYHDDAGVRHSNRALVFP